MSELYRDFIDRKADEIITDLGGTITPAPVNNELYRDFINIKANDVITALNGTITPPPAGGELYRDFLNRKFNDVIAGIGGYVPPISFPTLTGSIVTFNSQYAGLPLKSHTVEVVATQSGSGTPSPSNPRSISGWSKIRIGQLGNSPLNSYFEGLYNGTYGFVDLGSLSWALQTSHRFQAYNVIYAKPTGNYDVAVNCFCSEYATLTQNQVYAEVTGITIHALNGRSIYVWDDSFDDAATFKTAMSGVYLIYELATPTTPTITDAQFDTLLTAFGVSGSMFTIQIGSTVYGGEYDARTGVLTCNWAKANTSTMNWNISPSGLFVSSTLVGIIKNNTSAYTPSPYIKCSAFECVDSSGITGPQGTNPSPNGVFAENTEGVVYFNLTSETTIEGFKAFMSDKQLIYELATPITIQLAPCLIDTLEGVNNIWADTGNTTLQYIKIGGNT